MANPKIFISYRRSDAGGHAGRLHAALSDHYGDSALWLDHSAIPAGADFTAALNEALASSDVLLAIIGPDWLGAEKDGQRRLDDPHDWVRREIATAMGSVRVIPVLVGEAELPTAENLPDDLGDLRRLQTIEVRPDRFEDDTEHLIKAIGGWRRRWYGLPLWAWALGALAFIAAVAVPLAVRQNSPPTVTPEAVQAIGGEAVEIDVLSWASDDHDDELTLVVDSVSRQDGDVQAIGGGIVSYTSPAGFSGNDSFEFTVVDGDGLATAATAFVDVQLGRLGGDFNVAVAEFSATGTDAGSTAGLSRSIYEQVEADLQEHTDVRLIVAEPATVGLIQGDTPDARAESAARLSDRTDSDVVVYGTLEIGDDVSALSTEFFLSDRGLTQAEELSGAYQLGVLELATSDPLAMSLAASDFLEPKITALSQLAIGLSYYQLNDYAEAERLFLEAAAAWPGSREDANGQEVIFHLLGNVAGQQNRLDDADSFYMRALNLNPMYARSLFGRAEVLFQRSKGAACAGNGDADLDGMEEAISQFEEVSELPAPALSFLDARARLQIGRVHLCLSANGVDRLDVARAQVESVARDFGDEPRLRNLVAETQQVLGGILFTLGDYSVAAEHYIVAIDKTLDTSRESAFQVALARIYLCHLDIPDLAEAAYVESERLSGVPVPRSDCDGP